MMDPVKIGSTIPAERIHNIIEKIPSKKKIHINYEDYKDRYIYSFSLVNRKIEEDIGLYNILTQFVREMILKYYIKDLIKFRMKKSNIDLGPKARKEVSEEVYELLMDKTMFIREKESIDSEICDYLIENNSLIVDGYLRFRSKSFNNLIDKALELAVDIIQLDMEYDEFINMLKYFVDTNPPEIDLVNLILKKDDFELLDSENRKINNNAIVETLEEFFQGQAGRSDILLSSLIGLSPRKIVVHVGIGKEIELLDILKRIFTNRIKICYGCSFCNVKIYKE